MLAADAHGALIHLANSRPLKCRAPDSAHLEMESSILEISSAFNKVFDLD